MKTSQLISKLKFIYLGFIKSRKDWQMPKKAQILIYDAINVEHISSYLKKYSVITLDLRGRFINIPCLLGAVITKNFWKGNLLHAYIDTYIKAVNPCLVITLTDNNKNFYRISNQFSGIKTIFFQNGVRTKSGDIFDNLIKSNSYHVDYMLVAGEAIGKHYLKYLTGQFIPVGTLANNLVSKFNDIKNDDVLFISQWHENSNDEEIFFFKNDDTKVHWKEFFSIEIKVLKLLSKWCIENKKNLKICGREDTKSNAEKSFFNNCLKQFNHKWTYIPKTNFYSSYKLIDMAHIVVCIDSTLGYESIARGKRTAFFSCRGDSINDYSYRFGWPSELPNNGPMWTNNQNELEFNLPRILNYLNIVNDNEWGKVYKNYKKEIMEFDQGNTYFVKLLDQLLSENRNQTYVN